MRLSWRHPCLLLYSYDYCDTEQDESARCVTRRLCHFFATHAAY